MFLLNLCANYSDEFTLEQFMFVESDKFEEAKDFEQAIFKYLEGCANNKEFFFGANESIFAEDLVGNVKVNLCSLGTKIIFQVALNTKSDTFGVGVLTQIVEDIL